jgi:acyl-CoA synthetase (NDP forming)
MKSDSDLSAIFSPRSVAVIGASTNPSKIGYHILQNLITTGFQGRIYPINPREVEILGIKSYGHIKEISDGIDLIVVAVSLEATLEVIEEAAQKGVKGAIIMSGGFREVGEEGREKEERLLQTARGGGLRLIGPNSHGIINIPLNLNAALHQQGHLLKSGAISFLSQGGDSGHGILAIAVAEDVGLSKYVGLGNSGDLDFVDFLRYLKDDTASEVIMVYIAGIQRGREFLELAREITPTKPIVAFKTGKTELASRVEASHTGSLAGSYQVYEAAFKQAGIIECQHPLEMMDVAKALIMQPLPRSNGIAIVTMVGGPGVTAAETCALKGVNLCRLSDSTRDELKRVSPPAAITANPVDLTWGGTSPHIFAQAIKILLRDENVEGLIVIRKINSKAGIQEPSPEIFSAMMGSQKPIVACWIGEPSSPVIKTFQKEGIPTYPTSDRAASAMAGLVRYAEIGRLTGS